MNEIKVRNVFPEGFFVAELNTEIIGFINGEVTNESHIEDPFFKTMDLHVPNEGPSKSELSGAKWYDMYLKVK